MVEDQGQHRRHGGDAGGLVLLDEPHEAFGLEPAHLHAVAFAVSLGKIAAVHDPHAEDMRHRHGADHDAGTLPQVVLTGVAGGVRRS